MPGPELALAEAPCIRELVVLGYGYLKEVAARIGNFALKHCVKLP